MKKIQLLEILTKLSEQPSFQESLSFDNLIKAHNIIEDAESDRRLKGYILKGLLWLIFIEIISLIGFLFFQGIGHIPFTKFNFILNKWALGLFVSGCILHTLYLLRIIIAHLFPIRNHAEVFSTVSD